MKQKLIGETRRYVSDVSTHAVSNVAYILKENHICIEEMADSFSRMPEFLLTEKLLKRKADTWNLDGIAVIGSDEMEFSDPVFCDLFYEWIEEHPEMYEKTLISYIPNHKIIFSSPIQKQEKTVLIGVKNYSTVEKLLANTDFQGRGQSLIVNKEGKVVFSPEEEQKTIYDVYIGKGSQKEECLGNLILEKLKENYQGIFEVKDRQNSRILVSVRPLDVNDWVLLTVVPQDILSKTSTRPIIYFISIILFSACVFIAVLRYIYKSQKKMIHQLKDFAFVDPITNGVNSLAFQMEGSRMISEAEPGSYAVVFFNIINFKQVNERWGITEGNKVLKYIYGSMLEILAPDECAARSEIDHYFLLLRYTSEDELKTRISDLVERIDSFKNCSEIKKTKFNFDFSIGIYVIEDITEEIRLCQGKARRAAGFGQRKNTCTFYDNTLVRKELYDKQLSEMFETALEKEEFEIYLQPKVYLNCEENPAAEALIRWKNPKEGMIYPSDFIPLFEKNGMICRLDLYVFEHVCKLMDLRKKEKKEIFPVSVNLSRAHLKTGSMEFVNHIITLKEKYHIPDGILEIEMTESIMIEDHQLPAIKKMIDTFHENGILCSLDDFGYGFSSLGILKVLDIDVIKLDRKFFMEENEKTWFIVSNFIELAHGLGIKTVAEGIEYEDQVRHLKEADCDMIQGYFYGKPMPLSEFILWYEKNRGGDL
ncbi:EAL domain-containing protein [Blautia sp.]|uniref:EAL domain-containing protein n=1 Tax=Blautia sp. TaxID=1955243 RepID=UPI003AB76DEF